MYDGGERTHYPLLGLDFGEICKATLPSDTSIALS